MNKLEQIARNRIGHYERLIEHYTLQNYFIKNKKVIKQNKDHIKYYKDKIKKIKKQLKKDLKEWRKTQ